MDSSGLPFGTPAPVNRRRSNNVMLSRMLKESDTSTRLSGSFRKQLFQGSINKSLLLGEEEDENTSRNATTEFELGTPVPRRHTIARMDATPATASKRVDKQPNFITPRLVKPDAKAFNSTGLMSKTKKNKTLSATAMMMNADVLQSPRPPSQRVLDTPSNIYMYNSTTSPKTSTRPFLKHLLPLSAEQERDRKRVHIDEDATATETNTANHDNPVTPDKMAYSPDQLVNNGSCTPPSVQSMSNIPSSPVRELSFLRMAPSPDHSGSESPLSVSRHRHRNERLDQYLKDRTDNEQLSSIPGTPPQQSDVLTSSDDLPSSPCIWHDASEEILLSQDETMTHAPPTNSLLHRLVVARNIEEPKKDLFVMEKKLNKLVINDYITLFSHFLRAPYFKQLDEADGQVFILPTNEDDHLATPSMPDIYIDYFDSEFAVIRTLGCGEFQKLLQHGHDQTNRFMRLNVQNFHLMAHATECGNLKR
ncbi:hypothetical protein BDF19DRAFT_205827 [Syncephalis fuscata]|nr:hypothetical protein BDF19DRAFT_205827 [Syncephalis fuscata]